MRPRRLTEAQSRRRVRALKRAGCNPQQHTLPDGTVVVTKKRGCDVRSNPWYNGTGDAMRENPQHEYTPNPVGGTGLVIGALLGAGALWWWKFRRRTPIVSSTTPPTTQPPLPAPPPPCEVTLEKLNSWGLQAGIAVIYLPTTSEPPSIPELQGTVLWPSIEPLLASSEIFVLVTSDGRFWRYENGVPVAAPDLRGRYCTESAS